MTPVDRIAAVLREHRIGYQLCSCGWFTEHGVAWDSVSNHLAEKVAEALQLSQEWAATCDQWKGGRHVRPTRCEAEDDIIAAGAPNPGLYACFEPPPPALEDMRVEHRVVGLWEVVE